MDIQIIKREKSWGVRYREKDSSGKWNRKYKTICRIDGRYRTEHQVRDHPEYKKLFARTQSGTSEITLLSYIEETYLPCSQMNKTASTYKGYRNLFRGTITPHLNGSLLSDYTSPGAAQSLLDKISSRGRKDGTPLSTRTLIHAKSFVSGVISHAIRTGSLKAVYNPMHRKLVIVEGGKDSEETHAHSLLEVEQIIAALKDDQLYRTLAAVAGYSGLRRGEIRGLKWSDIQFNPKTKWGTLTIQRSFAEGVEQDTKTESSKAAIPLIPQLVTELEAFRKTQQFAKSDSFIFEGPRPNVPYDISAIGNKHIKPIIGNLWHGWQPFRRQLNDSLLELRIPITTSGAILRHKQSLTASPITERFYTKESMKLMLEAMQRFSKQVDVVRRELATKMATRNRIGHKS